MGDVVNLGRARKAKVRKEKAAVADANRAKFGRTKAQKNADAAEALRQEQHIEGARRELPSEDEV